MTRRVLLAALVLALCAPVGLAQAGLIPGTTVALDPITTNNGHLAVVEWQGRIFVTSRGVGAAPPHLIYEFDATGALIGTYEQSAAANAGSVWGYRDGCVDPATGLIYWGYEGGVEVVDPSTLIPPGTPGVPLTPVTTFANATVGTFRGMAWDPTGDGGAGSIWTANFGSPLYEVSATAAGTAGAAGTIITTFPLPLAPNDWSVYGLAYDGSTGFLWANSAPNAGPIAEIDTVNGVLTGRSFARATPGSTQGGLSPLSPGSPLRPASAGPGLVLIGLDQATPDSYSLYDTSNAAVLLTGVSGSTQDQDLTVVFGSGVLDWNLESSPAGSLSGAPAATILTIGTVGTPPTDFTPIVPGFQLPLVNGLSIPGAAPGQPVIALADGLLGGLIFPLATNQSVLGILPSDLTVDDPTMANTVVPVPFPPGTAVYGQSVYLDGGAIRATNVSGWEFQPPASVIVEAVGANSFNSDTTSGFFRIINVGGVQIQDVTFDFATSPNPAQATMVFDTDQVSMADIFEGGNSNAVGCLGTYRNGCDASCGLVYDAANTVPATPCDPAANTGWIGTNPTITDSWKTLQFRFTSFNATNQVFEFDCDTDGGAGTNGGSMDGMVVTITTSTGVLTGVLAADPADPNRAFLVL